MKTHVEFRSEKFPPYDGEEAEIQEPIAEDWGVAVNSPHAEPSEPHAAGE
ncbi:MAG: hypothetical protein HY000_16685 [Planctomycetes bacterium]|nr:hypothetical protein [Planctomycetota bacterium]